ncbi:MAG: site-specific DNA-methyltransferase [Anaerolineae bacterium]|nr:site-specific DNA-methyltransferase [Anaerolineae bacterium]MBL8106480.1 site-specific DNA-methyltransferase [Anaerolineales bacterium]MCC7190609.1 site-specific DNA-methyltransferase [Anaerolineales bacterium]
MLTKSTVATKRKYNVLDVKSAKKVATFWLERAKLEKAIDFGLPEVDDRYHIWRVPLVGKTSNDRIGEVVIDAYTSLIVEDKSTNTEVLESRLLGRNGHKKTKSKKQNGSYVLSSLRNTIAQGDSEELLQELPAGSVNLIFTSPPYYNARPEYTDYVTYEEYLLKIRKVIQNAHRVLAEGCFFVMNISPVLVRRASRNEASRRIAVPFDMHRLFIDEGYDFIDDIVWEKPEGAGWATGRGRRFAADRNPLQYKPVPVTEYILVYRKHTEKLIDWNIRAHPDKETVKASKVGDGYDRTNIWKITPAHDHRHPAIFPVELAERVIKYYSFKGDVVLDPFAGIGTVGKAAVKLHRRFVLLEQNPKYISIIQEEAKSWLGKEAKQIHTINCAPIDSGNMLF